MNSLPIGQRTLTERFSSTDLFLRLCAFLFFFPPTKPSPIVRFSSSDQPRRNEMLVPINSTSALICESVFFQRGQSEDREEAKWMKDGTEVGRVNGHSNVILGMERTPKTRTNPTTDHRRGMEPIPKIGFLVITNTWPQDEGEYWCESLADGQRGESTRLKVAYLTPFEPGQRPKLVNGGDQSGSSQLALLECPKTLGVPPPVINWLFNGDRIDFASQNMQMVPNGSLLVHNISANQSGFFACEAANFVGRSISSEFFLAPPKTSRGNLSKSVFDFSVGRSTSFLVDCLSAYVRNGVLWFLIGCLATSCFVLAYILGALLFYRFYSLHHNRHRFFLSFAPGFRKTVAPMAEQMTPPPALYFDSASANEL